MKLHISELHLPNVHIQQRNLFLFQPWSTLRFHYINPFATYSKSTVATVVFNASSPTTAVSIVVIRPSTQIVRNVQITLAVEL
ncbi:hypothetical protein TNCV_4561651 [Trichonephila clavipes]|nr:hypothetical protein TNCV_4561651 [Trichonephila clavipes]